MLVQSRVSRSQAVREARARRALIIRLARQDVNTFCEFVLKDEKTGTPVEQAPAHTAWHGLADEHDRLLIWSHIESGKTSQLSVARTLYELGHDPTLRILVLSNTKSQAAKVSGVIQQYVEQSSELRDVFPDLKPGTPWGAMAFSVARATHAKDFSVQTAGVHGNIQGARLDRVVLDDILDFENTRTQDQRKQLIEWFQSACVGRMTEECRVRCVGTGFHPQDLLHQLARSGYAAFRYPVVDPRTGELRWPERWPAERIAKKSAELGPIEAQRQLMCEARDDASSKFKREWIDIALRLGEGTQLCSALTILPRGYRTYTGVDLAVSPKDTADKCAIFSIAVDPFGVRSLLNIETGRWSGPDIIQRIRGACIRYQSIGIVENNAAQDFIVQFLRAQPGPTVPIIPYTTGRSKAHPEHGVEGLAAEMAQGKWKIPNTNGRCHPEVQAWIDEMLFYDPAAHTGDRLMASFFAREGVRLGDRRAEPVTGSDFTRR